MNKLSLSYLFTSLGHWLILFIVPLIILEITNSPFFVSIVFALDTLPYIIFTPFSGILGDKFNRKLLIQIGEFLSFLSVFLLFIIPYNNTFLYLIICLSFLVSISNAMHHPIFNSIIPDLFNSDDYKKVNSSVASISNITGIIAPAIIGTFLLKFDYKSAIFCIFICYLLSLVLISLIKYEYKKIDHKGKNIFALLKEGFLYVINHKVLLNFSLLFFFMVFGLGFITGNFIWIFSNFYGLKDFAYYYVLMGILAIIGAQIASKFIVDKFNTISIINIASLIIAILSSLLLLSPNPIIFSIIIGLIQGTNMIIVVTYFTYRQKEVPSEILSRVVSVTRLVSFMAGPLGTILGGYILDKYYDVNIIYILTCFFLFFAVFIFYILNRKK